MSAVCRRASWPKRGTYTSNQAPPLTDVTMASASAGLAASSAPRYSLLAASCDTTSGTARHLSKQTQAHHSRRWSPLHLPALQPCSSPRYNWHTGTEELSTSATCLHCLRSCLGVVAVARDVRHLFCAGHPAENIPRHYARNAHRPQVGTAKTCPMA